MKGRTTAAATDVVDVLARSPGMGDAPALVGPQRTWTYAQLDRAVDEQARMLRTRAGAGVAPVLVDPVPRDVIALLAHWRAGITPAPLDGRLAEPERERADRALSRAPVGAQVVLWTSGSAGRPRGVALSFGNLEASVAAATARLELSDRDVWLASLAPTHVGGLMIVVRSILLGGCLVAVGRLDPGGVSDLLDGKPPPPAGPAAPAVTHVSLVPTQLHRLLGHRAGAPPPGTLRCVLVGGAHAPERLVADALAAGWPLALTYGMTEMCSQVATAPPAQVRIKPGTVGRPLDGVELAVAEDGELLTRGPTRALGYVTTDDRRPAPATDDRRPAPEPDGQRVTTAPHAPDFAALVDEDGWYHTGDYGRLDANGDLWVTGRRTDKIVTGGVTVDAVEVEEALRTHPAVVDACVVGVSDPEWGERVGAWVVPVWGELDLDELDRHVGSRLGSAKRPRVWRVDQALPVNANGKADRVAVRRALERA